MKYLLHCVFRVPGGHAAPACGPDVCTISAHGLGVAASPAGDLGSPPTLARLLAYQQVISAFHACRTVIPLRYGCVVGGRDETLRLLADHQAHYQALLDRLDGTVEMGLRILRAAAPAEPGPPSDGPGARYLAGLRTRQQNSGSLTAEDRSVADRVCAELSGLYRDERREASPAARQRVVSMYFLVPRISVGAFQKRLSRIDCLEAGGWLSTGPWPPFNFVSSELQYA
jgi:gas vesicle protein GvpL/GvpF